VLEAVTGADGTVLGSALVEMSAAKTQAKAGVALIRFADEMYEALLEIGRDPQPR
jgi:tryptophan synthase alpha subunit